MSMEKNAIITTAKINRDTIAPKLITTGAIVIVIAIIFACFTYKNGVNDRGKYFWWDYHSNPVSFFFGELFHQLYGYIFLGGMLDLLSGVFLTFLFKDSALTVTDKDIHGYTSFGKAVSILITQVSSIELAAFDGIKISTSSGPVYFWNLRNRTEVFDDISTLLKSL